MQIRRTIAIVGQRYTEKDERRFLDDGTSFLRVYRNIFLDLLTKISIEMVKKDTKIQDTWENRRSVGYPAKERNENDFLAFISRDFISNDRKTRSISALFLTRASWFLPNDKISLEQLRRSTRYARRS